VLTFDRVQNDRLDFQFGERPSPACDNAGAPMTRGSAVILAVLGTMAAAPAAQAQAPADRIADRISMFGVAGAGTFGDDEGTLGGGFVAGGGVGIDVSRSVRLEAAVTTTRHKQTGSIIWEGRPTIATGRVLWQSARQSSRVRPFVGGGLGFGYYSGTRTDSIYDSPLQPPRMEIVAFTVNGLTTEVGGGTTIGLSRRAFIRPEAWLVMMGGERTQGLEPTLMMPRASASVGMRF
jgi:hypothetical protein